MNELVGNAAKIDSSNGENSQLAAVVEFLEVPDILYDGKEYKKYIESNGKSFSVGGKKYYSRFELGCFYHTPSGFIYFNLEKIFKNAI